jgi:hypothetical protein
MCCIACHGGTNYTGNIAIGVYAGERNCCPNNDITIGACAGRYRYSYNNATQSNNIYLGGAAGEWAYGYCGGCSIGIGVRAMTWGGWDNIGIGVCAGRYNCTTAGGKGQNVLIGGCAGYYIGCRNVAIGITALYHSKGATGIVAVGAQALKCVGCLSVTCLTIGIGFNAGSFTQAGGTNTAGHYGLYLGRDTKAYTATSNWQYAIGSYTCAHGANTMSIGNANVTTQYYCGCMIKSGGSFRIVHPNPEKKDKFLYHSFIESPTAGDNLYRWSFNVSNCEHCFKLPNYYKYLNECNMAWVYPADHFGEGHAKLDDTKENLIIKTNKDGCYNVLLMGTRCDELVKRKIGGWRGTEVDMTEQEIKSNYDKNGRICSLLAPTEYNDSHTP